MGYTYSRSDEIWKMPKRSSHPMFNDPHRAFYLNSARKSWLIEPQMVFDTRIGALRLESIIGATFQENAGNQLKLQGSGYASEALIGNLAAAESVTNASTSNVEYRYNANIARHGLNWAKKYYLNLTGRRDGS